MAVDLHIHTTCSDGTSTPEKVVGLALRAGLSAIAITDHDAVAGVQRARQAAGTGMAVVSGVELSARAAGAGDVHLLGYLVDSSSPTLIRALEAQRRSRVVRAVAMIDLLNEAGYEISIEDVLRQAADGAVGRSHVARALLERGEVPSVEHAFRELIGEEMPFYVAKHSFRLPEAVALVHGASGVVVLAHPGISGDGALMELVEEGLDGIEAYHAEHTPRQRAHYLSVATRFGLVATGGSDFHGVGTKSSVIGAGGCPDSALAALRERALAQRS